MYLLSGASDQSREVQPLAARRLVYSPISLLLWLSNDPDMNPVKLTTTFGVIKQRVYETWVNNVDELNQLLVNIWRGLQQRTVNAAESERRKHLQACLHIKGGHFEHLL